MTAAAVMRRHDSSQNGSGAGKTGSSVSAGPIRTTSVFTRSRPRFSLPPGAAQKVNCPEGARETPLEGSLLVRQKRMGGASPRGQPLHWQVPPRFPAKFHHNCPPKTLQNRKNALLTGTDRSGIVSSNLKRHRKGRCPGKTPERSRRRLQAALADYRSTATTLEPPTDM